MFGHIMLIICVAIWCACAAFALAALAHRAARSAWLSINRRKMVMAVLTFSAVVSAFCSRKAVVTVSDAYIQDAGSYLTNDVAHVAIAKRTPNLPDSTEILVYARELSSTNAADWFRLSPHLTFADHPYDYSLPNATNYSVLVSSSFVPEPTVHTNGVWALRGFEIPGHPGKYAFGNSRVRTIVTASDYVQDGLVAMWDGIENAGWGTHDPNATVWKDLTGNGYDLPLSTATLEVLSNGVRRKSTVTHSTASKVRWINTPSRTLEICVTAPSSISSGSQVLLATTSVGSGTVVPCVVKKGVGYFEWSQQWNSSKIIFKSNITLTLSSSYNYGNTANGYVNGEVQASDNTDTWGFTADTISVLGDPRGTNYAPFEYCAHNVRIYSRALTAEEIEHNYKIDRIRFNLP